MNKNTFAIRPSKDIQTNYTQLSALAQNNPVVITVNGREDTVLLGYKNHLKQQDYINELESKIALYTHLADAMDDVRLGRVCDESVVFEEMVTLLENA
ncbi:MAG: hypothetical protein II710_00580 [Clostridia bacterium]|nr:hypothetical protein [Clostridia bacterium]